MPGLFVAQVERLSARIAHRVVVPGREAEQVGVLAPRVAESAFRDDGAETRSSQCTFTHGAGVVFPAPGAITYSRPVRRESADPIRRGSDRPRCAATRAEPAAGRCGSARSRGIRTSGGHATVDLVRQRSAAVRDDRACDRLEQDAVLGRNLLRMAHEDAARPIDRRALPTPAAISPMICSCSRCR